MPMSGTMRVRDLARPSAPERSPTKSSGLAPVAVRILAMLSVEGQRSLPLAALRLLLLKVVGSSPASFARPDGDMPLRAASASIARQIWGWVSILDDVDIRNQSEFR